MSLKLTLDSSCQDLGGISRSLFVISETRIEICEALHVNCYTFILEISYQ